MIRRLWRARPPPTCAKVFIALDIKDVPYEIVRQMPFSEDAEYLKDQSARQDSLSGGWRPDAVRLQGDLPVSG